jgi:thiol-disulfide isomerase/thioredoxin
MKFFSVATILTTVISGDSVKSVTGEELDKLVAEGKTVFTKFFSPKCPHCVSVAPLWEELAKKSVDVENFVVADVDCTMNRDACKRYNVQGVPSLQLIQEGSVYLYKGARDVAEFAKFALEEGYKEAGVTVSATPGAQKIKTVSEKVIEGLQEVFQQFSAIANYSPLVVFLLIGLGFLSGASVTAMVTLAAKQKASGPCAGGPCEEGAAVKKVEQKKAGAEKTD